MLLASDRKEQTDIMRADNYTILFVTNDTLRIHKNSIDFHLDNYIQTI